MTPLEEAIQAQKDLKLNLDAMQKGYDGDIAALKAKQDELMELSKSFGKQNAPSKMIFPDVCPAGGIKAYIETPAKDDATRELQTLNDRVFMLNALASKQDRGMKWAKSFGFHDQLRSLVGSAFKGAMDTAETGGGLELVPTDFSARMIEKVRLQLKVANMFEVWPMQTTSHILEVEGADSVAYKATENTSHTGQTAVGVTQPATAKVTFTATGLAARTLNSKLLAAGSIINVLDYIQRKMAIAHANAIEKATLNGDTTTVHMDADTELVATDAARCWKGFRKLAVAAAQKDAAGNGLDSETGLNLLRDAIAEMGVYGTNPARSPIVLSIRGHNKAMRNSAFQGLDKLGPLTPLLAGQLGAIDAHPVIVSEWMKDNLDASGVNTSATTAKDKSCAICFNADAFMYGRVGTYTFERSNAYLEYLQDLCVSWQFMDFEMLFASTDTCCGVLYNVGV